MKSTIVKIGIGLVLLSIFLFGALYAFHSVLLSRGLVYAIETNTPLKAKVRSVQFNFWQGIVAVSGLELFEGSKTAGRLEKLQVDFDVSKLSQNSFHVESFFLSGLDTEIFKDNKLFKVFGIDLNSLANKAQDKQSEKEQTGSVKTATSKEVDFLVSNIEIRDLNLGLQIDGAIDTRLKVKKLLLDSVGTNMHRKKTELSFQGSLADQHLTVTGEVSLFDLSLPNSLIVKSKNIDLEKVSKDFKLSKTHEYLSGSLSLNSPVSFEKFDGFWAVFAEVDLDYENLKYGSKEFSFASSAGNSKIIIPEQDFRNAFKITVSQLGIIKAHIHHSDSEDSASSGLIFDQLSLSELEFERSKSTILNIGKLTLDGFATSVSAKRSSDFLFKDVGLKHSKAESTVDMTVSDHGRITFKKMPHKDRLSLVQGKVDALDLSNFGALLSEQIGYDVRKGLLSADFEGKISEKSELEGKLTILLDKLELDDEDQQGKKIERKSKIPLATALKVMNDKNDQIHMEFDTDGNLNSPKFSPLIFLTQTMGSIVLDELTKKAGAAVVEMYLPMLVNTISPTMAFTLIDKSYDFITKLRFDPLVFEAGSSLLSEDSKKKLALIASLLKNKPKLSLNFCTEAKKKVDSTKKKLDASDSSVERIANIDSENLGKEKESKDLVGVDSLEGGDLVEFNQKSISMATERLQSVASYLIKTRLVSPRQVVVCKPKLKEDAEDLVTVNP